ncbi:rabenosyn-5 [Bradysia coprophila]|uniref:rabenosyn-5 n=1 Tax=Bradysia coprophila TaxID=38358 RepID=UPI00187D8D5F|nr:rabenosyn-5 [Bradysia coprophila]
MSNQNLLEVDSGEQILEGFLCPICKVDLKTPDLLTTHVENSHSEDQDLLKSFKDIFLTATKKIRRFDESIDIGQTIDNTIKSTFPQQQQKFTPIYRSTRIQEVGTDLSHFSYFKSIRMVRLERYATETNKLIIRLHKLLTDRPSDAMQQKIHEQTLVPWLDGTSVKLCPNCAKKFNITRRQHHCRLCGSIMCHDCSRYLAIKDAFGLVNPTVSTPTDQYEFHDDDSLRICEHCLSLLENRKDMQDSQLYRPAISVYYEKIVQLKKDIGPDLVMYSKMITSLYDGDSIFTLADASALRGKIGLVAEKIDAFSKAVLSLDYAHGSREESLKKSIRLACIKYIKDEMLALEALPQEAEIKELQRKRKMETEQKIEMERRLAMQAMERADGAGNIRDGRDIGGAISKGKAASGSAVTLIDNWSGRQADTRTMTTNDPLIEQINIIKGYIKQARDALRFEEVAILELNLRELQQEFYNRQQL